MSSNKDCIIFGLKNCEGIAKNISKNTKIPLGKWHSINFADGEFLFTSDNVVRGKHVFLIQSTSKPVNNTIMELLIAVDTIKRSSSKKITVVMPYYGYSRQDRKTKGREPITSRLVADLYQVAGVDRILTIDIHSPQQQGFFSIPFDSLTAIWLLFDNFRKNKKINNCVIVSPDYGGVKRVQSVAEEIGVGFAIVDKRRSKPNEVEVSDILGDVKGKDCIIIDDMIDTAGTICASAQLLKKHDAKSVSILASHGLFNGEAIKKLSELNKNGVIEQIIITNTINHDSLPKFIKIVDISKMLSDAVDIFAKEQGSLSNVYHKYKYFKDFNS